METSTFIRRNWITNFSSFTKTCIGFTILAILVMFFEEDLGRILTPFIEPFLLLLLALVYLILVIISIIHILLNIQKISWHVFLPILINLITFLVVYYFFVPLTNLRVDTSFLIKKNQFDKTVQWVNQSIQNGDLSLEEGKEKTIVLPKEFRNLADQDRIYITQENGAIRILFSRGGGMLEYYPSYMYHSANISPPIKYGDIVCGCRIKPYWYDCH